MKNPLVEKYGGKKRWVSWKLETVDGKLTKVPYQMNGNKASSTDPSTHAFYFEIKTDKKGIVLLPDKQLICIDIDHCLKDGKIDHTQKETIADLILEADSYTEISNSGEGLHIFIEITEALDLVKKKHEPFEVYTDKRYIAVTENCYGEPKEVRTMTPDEVLSLLKIIGYPWDYIAPSKEPIKPSELSLDDETILAKMFKSKLGKKAKALYEGDISEYKNDASKADNGLCSLLAFWTGKNAEQMKRIFLASPLGQREKTQGRADYVDMTITYAVTHCTKVYETPVMKIVKENPDLDLLFTINKEKDKVFTQNTENMCRVLRKHIQFQGRFRYDSFKNILEILPNITNVWRTVEDNDSVNIQTAISILFPVFGKVGKDMVFDAIIKVAKENTMDSASDYIRSLRWDGTARLDTWICKVYGAPEDKYHIAVGSNWLKGLVKRIVEPGCKFDYVLVLEGEQGSRKSTSLYVLGGSWHVETAMSTDSKDFFMQFSGKAIIEFSEGETLNRTEVKRMKAIITMQSDKYRPPYERTSQEFPRRCVFAMTTNQSEYLKDETGNRRWLPVKLELPEANVDWLAANREQLFAEAYHRVFNLKEKIYEFPKEETLAAQAARRIHDENEDVIADWYFNKLTEVQRLDGITTHQVYRDAICGGYVNKPIDRWQEMKISDVLKTHLQLKVERVMRNGLRANRWFDKDLNVLSREATREISAEEIFDKMKTHD
jgi:predicted P-loop ATPase